MYSPTTNALIVTGDGIAQAYRIGAPLMDMEMVQYHPTTLVENGLLITEGARGEGAVLLNSEGERFMERYAPNKMELASRDVVSRAEQTEILEGRGVGAARLGHLPRHHQGPAQAHARGAARDRQHRQRLRRRGHHARTDHDPPGPALHHGRREDRRRRRHLDRGAVCRRARSRACRCTAATAWARTHCWTRSSSVAAPASTPPGARSTMAMPAAADAQLREDVAMIDAILARERGGGGRVSEIKEELGETMNQHVAVYRDEAGLQQAREIVTRLKEESERAYIDDRGTVFNQDVLGAIELGYMLDCAEAIVRRRDRAQGVPRRAVPHRLPRAQRRGVAQAHRHLPERRWARR